MRDSHSFKTVSTNHSLFEEKGEPKRNRAKALLLTSLTNALPLGQTGSQRSQLRPLVTHVNSITVSPWCKQSAIKSSRKPFFTHHWPEQNCPVTAATLQIITHALPPLFKLVARASVRNSTQPCLLPGTPALFWSPSGGGSLKGCPNCSLRSRCVLITESVRRDGDPYR